MDELTNRVSDAELEQMVFSLRVPRQMQGSYRELIHQLKAGQREPCLKGARV